jgi:hypothetical protein
MPHSKKEESKSMKNKVFIITMLVSSSAAFAQTATVDLHTTQWAEARGDWTSASGYGLIKVDPFHVSAPGSWISGSLEAADQGFAEGRGISRFEGGSTGHIDLVAKRGFVEGNETNMEHAIAQTTPGGLAQTFVNGTGTLTGFVQLPIDPLATATAANQAWSGNFNGLPAISVGANGIHVDINAMMRH